MDSKTGSPKTVVNEYSKKVDVMISALESEDRLPRWEKGFLASIMDRFYQQQRPLSDAQYETLEKIYRRYN